MSNSLKPSATVIAMEMLQSFTSPSSYRAEMPQPCKRARKFYDHDGRNGRCTAQGNQSRTNVTITITKRVPLGRSLVYTVSVTSVPSLHAKVTWNRPIGVERM